MPLPTLSLPYIVRPAKQGLSRPPMLILLHGSGGNENDLFRFASQVDERFLVLSVEAPFLQSTGRYVWFTAERMGGVSLNNTAQFEFGRQTMIKFVGEAAKAFNADPRRVYLMGFGQGSVVSLGMMLTNPEILAGVVVISGQIPPEVKSSWAPSEKFKEFPVMVLHGKSDDIFTIALGRSTSAELSTLPVVLTYREYGMGHYLTQECLTDAFNWLRERLDDAGVVGPMESLGYAVRLGSVHLRVRNLDRSVAFYMRYLGMKVVERTGKLYAFLSNDDAHHRILLQNVGTDANMPDHRAIGIRRVRFEVSDLASFARAYQTLTSGGVKVTTIDHLVCWVMYFKDPDGNGLGIYCDTRQLPDRPLLYQGRDLPLEPEKILAVLDLDGKG
ncbi:MAG TPA: VOC family protein [Anaerolineales bacterium]|nr:VOC family protein [Anaerolineales bacterium]